MNCINKPQLLTYFLKDTVEITWKDRTSWSQNIHGGRHFEELHAYAMLDNRWQISLTSRLRFTSRFTAFISIQKRCSFLPFRNKRMRERDREKHRHRSRSRSRSPSRKRRSRSRSRSPRRKHDRPSSPVASKSKSSKEKKSIPDNNDKELKR